MKMAELTQKGADELNAELVELRKEQFNLRMQRGAGQDVKPHLWQQAKKNIARVKTALRMKQGEA